MYRDGSQRSHDRHLQIFPCPCHIFPVKLSMDRNVKKPNCPYHGHPCPTLIWSLLTSIFCLNRDPSWWQTVTRKALQSPKLEKWQFYETNIRVVCWPHWSCEDDLWLDNFLAIALYLDQTKQLHPSLIFALVMKTSEDCDWAMRSEEAVMKF